MDTPGEGMVIPSGTMPIMSPTQANPAFEQPTAQIQELTERLKAAADVMQEAKADDTARWQAARDEFQRLGNEIQTLRDAHERQEREKATADALADMQRFLSQQRAPSKAAFVGGGPRVDQGVPSGAFLQAVMDVNSKDAEEQARGKAALATLGSHYQDAWGKSTLGSTDATGGYILPNAMVDQMLRPSDYNNKFRSLLTVINGVTVPSVDIPYRDWQINKTTAAAVVAWGALKENKDLVYGGYTATMYTLARIYDISKQFARKSAGAAEQDVMAEMRNAFGQGEANYIINGTGSSEPYGLLTAIGNAPAAFTNSTYSAAATLIGSVAAAIAFCAGDLAGRNVDSGLSAMMNAADYWAMLRQGDDDAGFYFNQASGPTAIGGAPTGTLISPWGIPVYPDTKLASPKLVVGDFSKLKLYLGESFRIDSSDVAGTRWDYNLIGFRGEMEMGFDARPAVYAGYFQYIADVAP